MRARACVASQNARGGTDHWMDAILLNPNVGIFDRRADPDLVEDNCT
jgi:hypothetical protein